MCALACVLLHTLSTQPAGLQGRHRSERTQLGQTSVFFLLQRHYIHIHVFVCLHGRVKVCEGTFNTFLWATVTSTERPEKCPREVREMSPGQSSPLTLSYTENFPSVLAGLSNETYKEEFCISVPSDATKTTTACLKKNLVWFYLVLFLQAFSLLN